MIYYLKHIEIDKKKWDACMSSASNGLIFGYSWYLDCVIDSWDALVMGDYEYIFPLTCASKYKINYLYNPMFAQQLGVFSKNKITEKIINEFFAQIPADIKLVDISLNYGNLFNDKSFKQTSRQCQYIDLKPGYDAIKKNYSTNLVRNLSKARKAGLIVKESSNVDQVVKLFKESKGKQLQELKPKDFKNLSALIKNMLDKNLGKIYEVYCEDELVASANFSVCNNRVLYVKGGSTEKGRNTGAMHFLMDSVIQQYTGKQWIFDFGGSSVAQVARFNKNFGTMDYEYVWLYKNELPFYIKWLKK